VDPFETPEPPPRALHLDRQRGLHVTFHDGTAAFLSIALLRRMSPSAEARAEREAMARQRDLELEDAHVLDLLEAFERLSASVDFTRLGDHQVTWDDTPIGLHQDDLVDRLARSDGRRMTLQSVFEGRSRLDRIGLFLALLELARQQRVRVQKACTWTDARHLATV